MLRKSTGTFKNTTKIDFILNNYDVPDYSKNNTCYLSFYRNGKPVDYYRGILSITAGFNRGDYRGTNMYSVGGYYINNDYNYISMINNSFSNENWRSISVTPMDKARIKLRLLDQNQTVEFVVEFESHNSEDDYSNKHGSDIEIRVEFAREEEKETNMIDRLLVEPGIKYSRGNYTEAFKRQSLIYNRNALTVYGNVESGSNKTPKFSINGNLYFDIALVVYTHDNRQPYFIGTLSGGNDRDTPWHFNLFPIHKEDHIVIKGGEFGVPLTISSSSPDIDGNLTITGLGDNTPVKDMIKVDVSIVDSSSNVVTEELTEKKLVSAKIINISSIIKNIYKNNKEVCLYA